MHAQSEGLVSNLAPDQMLRVTCGRCHKAGELSARTIAIAFGLDATAQDVLEKLLHCPKQNGAGPCQAKIEKPESVL